mgnify:FL=1
MFSKIKEKIAPNNAVQIIMKVAIRNGEGEGDDNIDIIKIKMANVTNKIRINGAYLFFTIFTVFCGFVFV